VPAIKSRLNLYGEENNTVLSLKGPRNWIMRSVAASGGKSIFIDLAERRDYIFQGVLPSWLGPKNRKISLSKLFEYASPRPSMKG